MGARFVLGVHFTFVGEHEFHCIEVPELRIGSIVSCMHVVYPKEVSISMLISLLILSPAIFFVCTMWKCTSHEKLNILSLFGIASWLSKFMFRGLKEGLHKF